MQAFDVSASVIQPVGFGLAVGLGFLLSFLTPYIIGPRLRQSAQEELPPGIRARRQWSVAGVSLAISFILPLVLFAGTIPEARAVVFVAALAGVAGLINDALALRKFVLLLMAFAIAAFGVSLGLRIDELKPPFTVQMVELEMWSIPVSALWLLAVAYAVILLRRLPGLTAGVVAMVSATFGIAALAVGGSRAAPVAGLMGLVMAAGALGTLRKDYPKLGSGAHWAMGFALGGITIVGMLKNTAFLVLGVPLLALGVPVGETTYAVILRVGKDRQRFALGQRWELLHEALIRSGLSPRRAVLLFELATLYLCMLALALVLIVRVTFLAKLLILMFGLAFGVAVFFMLARIWCEPKATDESHVDMFGVPLAKIDMEAALRRVDEFIAERSPHMVVTSDSPSIVRARDDVEYQEIVRSADIVTADGRGVVWMARVLGLPMTERVSGVDLVERICRRAAEKAYSVYLLGAEPGVAEDAARRLEGSCPGLQVVGTHDGYFAPEEELAIVDDIAGKRPDILFVALGAPRQEKWIRRHMSELQVPVAIGVGGSLDVLAGRVRRAPECEPGLSGSIGCFESLSACRGCGPYRGLCG